MAGLFEAAMLLDGLVDGSSPPDLASLHRAVYATLPRQGPDRAPEGLQRQSTDGRHGWIFGLPIGGSPIVRMRGTALPATVRKMARPVVTPAAGCRAWFVLRANVTRTDHGTGRHRRHQLHSLPEQRRWLVDRQHRHGFAVDLSSLSIDAARATLVKDGRTIVLSDVAYSGQLTVADPASLATALATGIGPSKAYGFGYLHLNLEG